MLNFRKKKEYQTKQKYLQDLKLKKKIANFTYNSIENLEERNQKLKRVNTLLLKKMTTMGKALKVYENIKNNN